MQNSRPSLPASPFRRGSIPLVMLVVTLLGVGASASLFLTSGTKRMDKHGELGSAALQYANCALDEMFVKLANKAADFDAESRYEYQAHATGFLGRDLGIEVKPVQVYGQRIHEPADPQREKFERDLRAMLSAGPLLPGEEPAAGSTGAGTGSAPATGTGAAASPDWKATLRADTASWVHKSAFAGFAPVADASGKQKVESLKGGGSQGGGDTQRINEKVKAAFARVPVLSKVDFVANPAAEHAGERQQFASELQTALGIADEGINAPVSAGCAGSVANPVGNALGFVTTGEIPDPRSKLAQTYSGLAKRSGFYDSQTHLVTASTEAVASVKAGFSTMTVSRRATAHRLVNRVRGSEAMDDLRKQLAGYLMHRYQVTPRDLAELGWITVSQDGKKVEPADFGTLSWDRAEIAVTSDLTKPLSALPQDRTQVLPFVAANALSEVRAD